MIQTCATLPVRARLPIFQSLLLAAWSLATHANAGDFSVAPIRAELKPGTLSETVTVTNHSEAPLRVSVRLLQWSQDDKGEDVLTESADLVYFPRQLEIPAGGKRLVRVGAKSPAGPVERTYRLFIEEMPSAFGTPPGSQVSVYFRFGLPIFLPPAAPKVQADVGDLKLQNGQFQMQVQNGGNQHFRLTKVQVEDGAGFSVNIGGWYSLAGSTRTYTAQIPREVCRKASRLSVRAEGEGVRFERSLEVRPTDCG